MRDLPAHRRPLPLRRRLPRRVGRDRRRRHRRGRPRPFPPTASRNGCCLTTASRSTRRDADSSASSCSTCPASASSPSPASRTNRPPRARTNASTRPCSATSTSSPSPPVWPNCRPTSTRSTASTTPNVPTKGSPGASLPCGVGRHAEGPSASSCPDRPRLASPVAPRVPASPAQHPPDLPADTPLKRLSIAGTFRLDAVTYRVGGKYGLQHVLVVADGNPITVTDLDGEVLTEHTRPDPGVTYVGNGRPLRHAPSNVRSVTEVLRHQVSPMSPRRTVTHVLRHHTSCAHIRTGVRWREHADPERVPRLR